jgi:hypothetical protein
MLDAKFVELKLRVDELESTRDAANASRLHTRGTILVWTLLLITWACYGGFAHLLASGTSCAVRWSMVRLPSVESATAPTALDCVTEVPTSLPATISVVVSDYNSTAYSATTSDEQHGSTGSYAHSLSQAQPADCSVHERQRVVTGDSTTNKERWRWFHSEVGSATYILIWIALCTAAYTYSFVPIVYRKVFINSLTIVVLLGLRAAREIAKREILEKDREKYWREVNGA